MIKATYIFLAIAIGLASCGPTYVVQNPAPAPPPPPPAPVQEEVSYQTFYDDLSPYGQWVSYPGYGYVWAPNVGYGFKPYSTNGHWVYSDAGWVWASDYNWGWAPFHYGRWFFDNNYGWMWVPGYEWAPAWVSWRQNNDYYGWAPLSPGVSIGVSINSYNPPNHYWCFVPHEYVASPRVNNYYVNETKNVTIINNTTIINNNVTNNYVTNNSNTNTRVTNNVRNNFYAPGPDPNEVSRATGTTLRPVAINNSNKPGQQFDNNRLTLYRPTVKPGPAQNNPGSGSSLQHPAPARVQQLNSLRPISGNNNNINERQTNIGQPANGNAQLNNNAVNNDRPNANIQNNNQPVNSSGQPSNNRFDTNRGLRPANQLQSNNQPINSNGKPDNNAVNNVRPNASTPNNSQPVNANGQPGTNMENSNRHFNRPNNQPTNQPNNSNVNNQNQPGRQLNRNNQLQQQDQGQSRQQQQKKDFNRPPLNKDQKIKEKPKDENRQ